MVGELDELFDRVPRERGQVVEIADDVDVDALLVELRRFLLGEADEEAHQRFDFELGTRPVGEAERVERQIADAALAARAYDLADGACSLVVPRRSLESAPARPAPISIHDDGDVSGDFESARSDARWHVGNLGVRETAHK